jgi:glycosyltransferase involved in cell wall biosynthesis
MRLGIAAPNNFVDAPFGGTLAFVRNFLSAGPLPGEWRVTLIGVTASHAAEEHEKQRQLCFQVDEFLPVARSSSRTRIPLRARFMAGVFRARERIAAAHCDVFYVHSPEAALALARTQREVPILLHKHGLDSVVRRSPHWYARNWPAYRLFDLAVTKNAERMAARVLVTCGRGSFQRWIEDGGICPASKAEHIPAMVDTTLFAPARPAVKSPEGAIRLVTVCRLEAVKGVDLLIRTTRALRDRGVAAELTVVGAGSLKQRLVRLAEECGLHGTVAFRGALEREPIAQVFRESDLYLSGSHQEGFSLALLEALASGVPVVVTDVGGVRDVVRNGINGQIVGSRSPDEMAAACLSVLARGAAAKTAARESVCRFAVTEVAGGVADAIRRVAQGARPGWAKRPNDHGHDGRTHVQRV